jgi:hypothetical protein
MEETVDLAARPTYLGTWDHGPVPEVYDNPERNVYNTFTGASASVSDFALRAAGIKADPDPSDSGRAKAVAALLTGDISQRFDRCELAPAFSPAPSRRLRRTTAPLADTKTPNLTRSKFSA